MQIVETEKLEWALIVPNTRGGDIYRKVIHTAQGGDGVSYDVRIELFSEGDRAYTALRHRHDFEQLRFAVSGSMDLGFTTLNEGEVGYFPANAYYGPQKCAGAIILIAQWGDHFITKEASDRAVAELSETGKFSDGIYHGVLRRGFGWDTPIDVPGARDTYPLGINDSGEIVGYWDVDPAATHGFYRSANGKVSNIDVPGAAATVAFGITDHGQIAGYYTEPSGAIHGFVESQGKFQTLDLPGAAATIVTAINNFGVVAGEYFDSNGKRHGFVATPKPEHH